MFPGGMRSRLNWPPSGFGVTANRLPLSPIGSIGPLSTTISTPLGSMSASPSANLLQFPQPEPPSPAIPPNVPPLSQIGRQNSIGHNNPRTFTFVPLRQPGSAGFPTARSKSKRPNMGMSRRQRKDFSALENLMISSRFPRTLSGSHEKPRNRARQRRKPVTQTDFASLVNAERLNLYIDRQQDSGTDGPLRLDPLDDEAGVHTFRTEPKTARERWKQNFRIALPHVGLVFLSAAYTLLGAAIFHHFETPYETHIRNATSQRVQALKNKVIAELWALATTSPESNRTLTSFDQWSQIANIGMNMIIKDVFIDYTKNYMTPDDIIYGTGPTKWSFGSSIFFSWTAITTIGYGHIVPRTLEGRVSCLLYALFGIPLILVTIADMGRFLSGGIVWVHNTLRKVRRAISQKCRWFFRLLCCRMCRYVRRKRNGQSPKSAANKLLATSNNTSTIAVVGNGGNDRLSNSTSAIAEDLVNNNNKHENSNNVPPLLPVANHISSSIQQPPQQKQRIVVRRRAPRTPHAPRSRPTQDSLSDAGTFEDISEIHTQEESDKTVSTNSEDTHARADELDNDEDEEDEEDEFDLHSERRVSVMFILVVMLGYTAGGACLMQLWERWDFMDAFYFCFVTVTTIGFGDIVPQNVDFLPATLCYIVIGLIITTMCIDLVGSEYIRDIHFYGRSLGRSFLTIGGKVVHLGEVFSYVAFLQKNYGLTPDQLDRLAQLPEEYLLDCLINGRQPDLNWIGGRPFIPPDIYYFKWIEQPRTLSFTSERVLASMESEFDLNTSRCSTARTLTPREYYQRILVHYCKQMQHQNAAAAVATSKGGANAEALAAAMAANEAIFNAASNAQNQASLFSR